MNITKSRKALVGSIAGLALVGGTAIGGIAVANAQTHAPSSDTNKHKQVEQQEAHVKGSITVPESDTEVPDAKEADQLAKLAKIDANAADAAAIAAVPGSSVFDTSLGDENGSLVYEVSVKDASGVVTEVKVDAGNATVLATEADDDANEGPEGSESEEANDGPESQDEADQGSDNGADGEMDDAQESATTGK